MRAAAPDYPGTAHPGPGVLPDLRWRPDLDTSPSGNALPDRHDGELRQPRCRLRLEPGTSCAPPIYATTNGGRTWTWYLPQLSQARR